MDVVKPKIQERTLRFAVAVINYSKLIAKDQAGNVISKQIIRSGISIGSNVQESQDASSKKDFIQKLLIALREAKETKYWLVVIIETQLADLEITKNLLVETNEIIAVLTTIIRKSKAN